uniref:NADH-plastoquinone oxidoreductase subunit J n=1 Tax=Aegilops tauschii subsp. strangulata TaxID=200361 RepID=A0A452XH60_AEGTS
MQQGWLSNWLVKHEVVHRSLGFDHRGIETLQIKAGDWDSIEDGFHTESREVRDTTHITFLCHSLQNQINLSKL